MYSHGRKPVGYWDTLRTNKSEPLIAFGPRLTPEWITAGRSLEPQLIAVARSATEFTNPMAAMRTITIGQACQNDQNRQPHFIVVSALPTVISS